MFTRLKVIAAHVRAERRRRQSEARHPSTTGDVSRVTPGRPRLPRRPTGEVVADRMVAELVADMGAELERQDDANVIDLEERRRAR